MLDFLTTVWLQLDFAFCTIFYNLLSFHTMSFHPPLMNDLPNLFFRSLQPPLSVEYGLNGLSELSSNLSQICLANTAFDCCNLMMGSVEILCAIFAGFSFSSSLRAKPLHRDVFWSGYVCPMLLSDVIISNGLGDTRRVQFWFCV